MTAIPLIRHDFWTFRIFEFARAQKLVLNILFLLFYSFFILQFKTIDYIIYATFILNLIYLIYQVFPYLPIAKKQIKSANQSATPSIRLLVANVYQYNREFHLLNDQILAENPDIVLLVETDQWWKNQCLENFAKQFPEKVLRDKENTYGMLLFSKLILSDTEVRYLIDEEIPSITTNVQLKNGDLIKLFALHPVPPVPTQNLYSTDRDAEILLIGKEAKKENLPVIVAGDLNDVAWSYTTNLFQKISGLLDPRRGRGFYSTFHAQKPLFRWPLDHIFCSTQFRLQAMKRLNDIGSDHFPILVQLHLASTKDQSDQLSASKEEKKDAAEKIENGKNNH
ncbi:hypothetical protein GYB57_14745 [bacterium]|nr:hypothetical protein [bacterium]